MHEHESEKRRERPSIAWLRAGAFLAIGMVVGSAGACWLWRGAEREYHDEILTETRGMSGDMAVLRHSRPLTDHEMEALKAFIPRVQAGHAATDATVEVANILVCAGVRGSQLGSVLGVSEDVLREWAVDPKCFEIRHSGHVVMSLELDEGGRICEARTSRGHIRAVVDEDSDGELRLIEPRGHDRRLSPK